MTDNELKDECMKNAEIDLVRYSYKELTQIREAMRMYADRKLKLFAIPDVVSMYCDCDKYHDRHEEANNICNDCDKKLN